MAPELAAASVSLEAVRVARPRRRRDLKTQLRQRRSLADALPADTRFAAAVPTGPEERTKPAIAGDDTETTIETALRHGLRLYATD